MQTNNSKEKVRQLQNKLYLTAKKCDSRRFHALYDKVYRDDVLFEAWKRVKANKGSSGVDGVKIEDVEAMGIEKYLSEIKSELMNGKYKPSPVKRVMIPKPDGSERPLGIPTVKDRIVQMATKIAIEPVFEADFRECSYGFRPKRSAKQALEVVRKACNNKGYYVVDADIEKFFDNVNQGKLMKLVEQRISDRRILKLIKQWLVSGVLYGNVLTISELGTSQGSVISPLLANIYLNTLDRLWEKYGLTHGILVRYADDTVIICKNIITQSMDEEKVIKRTTKTDFTVYNSVALDMSQGFRLHEDTLSQQAVDLIRKQPGVQNERYLYRNTTDDRNVLVDYGFEKLVCESTFLDDSGIVWKDCNGYNLTTVNESENRCLGNIMGASENFWNDILVFEGEKDKNVLKEKMITGEYVIIGYTMDRSTEEPNSTPMTDELQVGDRISFFKDGELVKTCTILAKAIMVGTELETPMGTSAQMNIGGDAPFVYISDNAFKQIYDVPTLLSYGFNVDKTMQAQMEEFLNDYKENDSSVAYTSTKLLKEQMYAQRDILLIVGGMIGAIMAFAGLINFTNMMVTNIITRRHEFAAMQSIGMTNRQLRRLIMDEGLYYAAGTDVIGGLLAAILGVTVLKNVLNSPSMWYFTLRFTLVPALFIAVIYLILAAIIPVVVLHFFNKGSVVERLRTE